jgi:vacuolar-type H+-ATPase subunit H
MIFLGIVGLSILAAYVLIDTNKRRGPEQQPETLGAQTIEQAKKQDEELAKSISEGYDTVIDTAEHFRTEIEDTTEEVVSSGKKQVENTANKVLYNATLKPIVDKIEELPQAQQEQLRKQICPIVDN